MWGSVIAAAALTILPEALRQFSNYRMLVYAIVLILVMLATNNPAIWGFFARLRERREEKISVYSEYSTVYHQMLTTSLKITQRRNSFRIRTKAQDVYKRQLYNNSFYSLHH